jgi:hypothetical protein
MILNNNNLNGKSQASGPIMFPALNIFGIFLILLNINSSASAMYNKKDKQITKRYPDNAGDAKKLIMPFYI